MVKKIILGAIAVILAVCFVTNGSNNALAAVDGQNIYKIGLFYGNDAMGAANLMNSDGLGRGYDLGYFDLATRQFVPLHTIDNISVTIVKDKLMYIGSDNTYYDTPPAAYKAVVKPYHLQVDGAFSKEQALSMISEYTAMGLRPFLAFSSGQYVVRIGEYGTQGEAEGEKSALSQKIGHNVIISGFSDTCYTLTITGTDTILFEFDSGGLPFGIMPRASNESKAQTWFKGYKYLGGFEYNRVNGNDITVSSVVSEADYLKGVVPYEMSNSWPIEALKVQTVCAASYAKATIGRHSTRGFDLCNTVHCQVYGGTSRAGANSDRAVDEALGKYIISNGKIVAGYYHSSSGGYTENSENIWGNQSDYLKGVPDTYLQYVKTDSDKWTSSFDLKTVGIILADKGYTVSEITDCYVSKYSDFGNAIQLTIVDKSYGKMVFSGESVRTILNSPSNGISVKSHRYTISRGGGVFLNDETTGKTGSSYHVVGANGDVKALPGAINDTKVITKNGVENITIENGSSQYVITGSGNGHNIGMSQWGARAMAEKGMLYEEILKYYYTGVTIGNVN